VGADLIRDERIHPYLWLALASLILAPVFARGLPCSDDTLTHLYRVVQLDLNLRQGAPFLVWSPDLLRGYGYPIFGFYAPFTYWLIEALHLLGLDFAPAIRLVFFTAPLLAGWGMYTWAARWSSRSAACVSALAYMFAPYLLYDTVSRGALPSALALGILPWALAACTDAQRKHTPRSVVLAAVAFSILNLTHNVAPIFGIALALGLSLIPDDSSAPALTLRTRFWSALNGMWPTVAALLLALALTAFFWLPALAEAPYTQARRPDPPFHHWSHFENHLLPLASLVEWPADPADPNLLNLPVVRTLGLAQAILAAIGLLTLLAPQPHRGKLLVVGAATLAWIYLASGLSRWWWQNVPVLNFIQLPPRFLGPASLGLARLSALAVDRLYLLLSTQHSPFVIRHAKRPFATRSGHLSFLLPALAVSLSSWPWLYPQYCPAPQNPTRATLVHSTVWEQWYAEAQGEVLPRWVDALPEQDALLPQYDAGQPVNRLSLPSEVSVVGWDTSPGRDRYTLILHNPTSALYRAFYFPGWQATLDGAPLRIHITTPNGLMAFDLPGGQHVLEISFRRTPIRVITLILSGLAAAAAILVWRLSPAPLIPPPLSPSQPLAPAASHSASLGLLTLALLTAKFVLVDRLSTPIRADRFRDGHLAGVAVPSAINFSNEITHLGYTAPAQVASGSTFRLTQYWTAQHPLGVPYSFAIHITSAEGNIWNRPPERPFGYADFPGTESWPVGAYARDAYEIQLLPGTPPGVYWLEASAFRRDIASALIPTNARVGVDPARARIGQIVVTSARKNVGLANAAVDTFSPTQLPALDGVTLLGWSVTKAAIASGDAAHVELLWRADKKTGSNHVARLTLLDLAGASVAERALTLGGPGYPTRQWAEGEVLRDQINWRIPPGLSSGTYTLQVGGTSIGSITVAAPERIFTAPPIGISTDVTFTFARLAGYTLSDAAPAPGEMFTLDLLWQATAETETSYRVFIHVRDETNAVRTQSDSVPAEWTRPTTGWLTGEYILDRHTLSLASDLPPGPYRVFVGLYNPATGDRLGETMLAGIEVR